jgi:hypothetical protein
MRTTVSIDDHLLARAKARAGARGVTLGTIVEESLRLALAADRDETAGPPVPVFVDDAGLAPGVEASTRGLIAALDDGLSMEKLR